MIAFYLVRGKDLDYLLNTSYLEKLFLQHAREQYYKEEKAKYDSVAGGKE